MIDRIRLVIARDQLVRALAQWSENKHRDDPETWGLAARVVFWTRMANGLSDGTF